MITYLQQSYPNLTETFVSAEIEEIKRRGVPVSVVTAKLNEKELANSPHPEIIKRATSSQEYVDTISSLSSTYFHSHFITEAVKLGLPLAEHLNIPFGFTVHAYDIWKRGARIEPELIAQIGNHPLCKVAAAEGTKHAAWLEWCSVPKEKIIITPNSVDETRLPERRNSYPKNPKNVLCIGRPVAKKGFFDGIDAIRLLRLKGIELNLKILGGIDPSKPLGEVVKQHVEHFDFVDATNLTPHNETLTELSKADILLVPSLVAEDGDSDGIPTVLAEAMLLGIPVVTTNVGSITDLVIDGKTGFVARAGDASSIASKILEAVGLFECEQKIQTFADAASRKARQQEIKASVDTLLQKLGLQNTSNKPTTDLAASITRSSIDL